MVQYFSNKLIPLPLLALLFLAVNAAESKSIQILNSYKTKGRNDGGAVQTSDGLIWNSTIDGLLRRLHPTLPNHVVSEKKLAFGVSRCITKVRTAANEEVVVIGHGNGVCCYKFNGTPLSRNEAVGSSFLFPPIARETDLVFASGDGLIHRLDLRNLSLESLRFANRPGTLTSPPALLMKPNAVVVVGTQCLGNVLTRETQKCVALVPLLANSTGEPTVFSIDLPKKATGTFRDSTGEHQEDYIGRAQLRLGILAFKPTVVEQESSQFAFVVTSAGKVLKVDGVSMKYGPLVELDNPPGTPVIPLAPHRFGILFFAESDSKYTLLTFKSDGEMISRQTVADERGMALSAKPTSDPMVFESKDGKATVLQGFSDCYVRLIDVETGQVLARNKTKGIVTNCPSQLQADQFLITEQSGELPSESTNQYLIKILED